jgi:pimeloyl-ACP methyl ester carboxylesterase
MRSGSWLRVAICVLMVTSTLACPGTAALAAPAAHTQAGDDCDATEVPSPVNQPVSGSVPVLFVHGLDSSPAIWDEGPNPITRQVAALQGVTAWTYDYSKVAVQWVTDPQIGLGLAGAITCLAQAAGEQVIVVAHSMGGLATDWAVNQIGTDGVPVANHVAKVITIGTPTKGSLSGAIAVEGMAGIEDAVSSLGGATGKALVAGVEAARSACAGEIIRNPQEDFCLWFGLDETPAGKALLYGSPELAALRPWPASVPVVAMAGSFGETLSVGGVSFSTVSLGDLVVSLGSATAYYTSGSPFVVTCPNVSLLDLVIHHDDQLCYHHNLPRNPQIDAAVLEQIRASVPSATSPSSSPTPSASSPGAPFTCPSALSGGYQPSSVSLQSIEADLANDIRVALNLCSGESPTVACTAVNVPLHPASGGVPAYYLNGTYACTAAGANTSTPYLKNWQVTVASDGSVTAAGS